MGYNYFAHDFNKNNEGTVKLKKAKFSEDAQGHYLDLTYVLETDSEVTELHIPKMLIPLRINSLAIRGEHHGYYHSTASYTADLGFGDMRLLKDKDGAAFTIKTIKEKAKEMTLEEIEKKLGHKVKIVSKETK